MTPQAVNDRQFAQYNLSFVRLFGKSPPQSAIDAFMARQPSVETIAAFERRHGLTQSPVPVPATGARSDTAARPIPLPVES